MDENTAELFYDVLIIGGGHGGAQAAIALRIYGFTGSVAIMSDEHELPYERPPLSKGYLAGEKTFERIQIRPAGFWKQRDIRMLLGWRVVAVNAEAHRVTTAAGETVGYGQLVWATGGYARKLTCSGHDLVGVHTVRTRADVDRMVEQLADTAQVAVIGGGYIGLEAAAALVKLGKAVTILEAQDRVLARVAGEPLSRFFEAEHRAHGVDVRLGVKVKCIEERGGRACGVRLEGGEVISAEMVLVGIGIVPAVEPLVAAGARAGNGVAVDGCGRTSLADVFAIGDCALHSNSFADGAMIRLESVQNANDFANTVAQTIMGDAEPYHAVPWFWSNQYDLKLQTVGLSVGHDATIVRGDIPSRSFSIVYLRQGRVVALDCLNSVRDYVQGKALVIQQTTADPALLADPATPLKTLAAAVSSTDPITST